MLFFYHFAASSTRTAPRNQSPMIRRGIFRPFAGLAAALLAVLTIVPAAQAQRVTRADSLRGSNGPGRAWWDVAFYDLHVRVNPADSSVAGSNAITYRVLQPASEMQIDLQRLRVDSIVQDGRTLQHRRDGNALFVTLAAPQ